MTSVAVDPTSPKNARTLYASVFDEGVLKSTDDGSRGRSRKLAWVILTTCASIV